MYQSFINLLSEAGYKKFMSEIGPVYVLEDGEDRQIVFLTYHKNQIQEPIYIVDYQDSLLKTAEICFPGYGQQTNILCILIVDDGMLFDDQVEESSDCSFWIQDEVSGKLYISKGSEITFNRLWQRVKNCSHQAKKELQDQESIEDIEKNPKQDLRAFFTPANMGLILCNIIVFILYKYFNECILEYGVMEWSAVAFDHQYYRFITSVFLHFDWEHLISNMMILFLAGNFVERYFGSFRYITSYLICGLAGSMLSFYFQIGGDTIVWSAGASGAIYGILGILAVLLIRTKGKLAQVQGPGLFILVVGSIFQIYQNFGTDNWAHLGGLAAGVIIGIVLKKKRI